MEMCCNYDNLCSLLDFRGGHPIQEYATSALQNYHFVLTFLACVGFFLLTSPVF